MTDESGEERVPMLSETELCVVYTGTSDFRYLNAKDLSGDPGASDEQMIWGKGAELPWADWERLAGSRERALEIFRVNGHEFALAGPGADELLDGEVGEEEFSIGGVVAESVE